MMYNRPICVIDFETTGTLERIQPTRITEIGIVKLDTNYNEIDTYHSYINPEEKLTQFIIDYTGITDDLLKDKPKFSDIANDIVNFFECKECIIAAWPLSFELPILQYEFANASLPFLLDRRGIDIGTLAQYYMYNNGIQLQKHPKAKELDYRMDNVIYSLEIEQSGKRHSALGDAETEADILIKILKG